MITGLINFLFVLLCAMQINCQPPEHLATDHRAEITGRGVNDHRIAQPERIFFGLVVPCDQYALREQQVLVEAFAASPDYEALKPIYKKRLAIYAATVASVQWDRLSLNELWHRSLTLQQQFDGRQVTAEELMQAIAGESIYSTHPVGMAYLDYVGELTATRYRFQASELACRYRERRLPPDGQEHYRAIEARLKELADQARIKIDNPS